MGLDTDTITVFLAILSLATGITLFVVGRQARAGTTALLWAFANVLIALGVILLTEQRAEALAYLCILMATALMWTSIVAFNGKPLPSLWLIAGGLVWAFATIGPPAAWDFGPRAAIYMGIAAVYLTQCAVELWRGRAEKLPARWPLFALVCANAASAVFGTIVIIPLETIGDGPDRGVFWPIYLTTTLYIVGTAVFLLAMVKERALAEQKALAQTDHLTGLANRGALMASGAAIFRRATMDGAPFGVILFDLDRFKSVNDNHSHRIGDLVLQRFAAAAVAGLRPNDMVGRIGGEEFLAVIPGADLDSVVAIADRIRRGFAEAAENVDGRAVGATLSAGVAMSRPGETDETLEDLLDRADGALYAAKAAGRDRVSTADDPRADNETAVIRLA